MAILHPVADALDTAHAAGLVHRDVKPANILLAAPTGRDGHEHVYLTDFGLTKRTSALTKLTATGNFIGTMAYISPEQIRGEPLDARTDMYAFGCVAYECLTGVPPFVKDDQAALLWAHLSDLPRPISDYRPELAAADSIVMRALAKKPNDRYQVCEDFVEALSEAVLTARHRKSSLTTAESALVGSLSDGPDHPTGPAPALPSGRSGCRCGGQCDVRAGAGAGLGCGRRDRRAGPDHCVPAADGAAQRSRGGRTRCDRLATLRAVCVRPVPVRPDQFRPEQFRPEQSGAQYGRSGPYRPERFRRRPERPARSPGRAAAR